MHFFSVCVLQIGVMTTEVLKSVW